MINFPCIEILSSITEEGAIIIKLKSLSLFNLRDPPGFKLGAIRYSVAWFPHAKAEVVVSLFVAFSLTVRRIEIRALFPLNLLQFALTDFKKLHEVKKQEEKTKRMALVPS